MQQNGSKLEPLDDETIDALARVLIAHVDELQLIPADAVEVQVPAPMAQVVVATDPAREA